MPFALLRRTAGPLRPLSAFALLIALLPGLLAPTLRADDTPTHADPERFELSPSPRVSLRGQHFRRSGAPPVLLLHGTLCNTETYEPLARRLHAEGFDVHLFAFRDHGNGALRSTVSDPRRGELGMAAMIEDTDAAVRAVAAKTGKKVFVVGHSLGGEIATLYAAGALARRNGQIAFSQEIAATRASKYLAGISPIATPTLQQLLLKLKLLAAVSGPVAGRINLSLPSISTPKHAADQTAQGRIGSALRRASSAAITTLGDLVIPDFVLDPANLTDSELSHLVKHGLSGAPADLIVDISRWAKGEFASLPRIDVPVLAISFGQDQLASPAEVRTAMQALEARQPSSPLALLEVADLGHVDGIAGRRGLEVIVPRIADFIHDPASLDARPSFPRVIHPMRPRETGPGLFTRIGARVGDACLGWVLQRLTPTR